MPILDLDETIPFDATQEPELKAAAERVIADVDAVRDDDHEPVNRDPAVVVGRVHAANKRAQAYLPQLQAMPGIDIASIRKLGDYADALLYFSASANTALPPTPELNAMIDRGFALRERALHDLDGMVRHGAIPAGRLEHLGGNTVHSKVGHDLVSIAQLVQEYWPKIEGKSFITLAAMDEVAKLGRAIVIAVEERELAQAEHARDLVRRNKAYTLVVRAYGELRDGMAYIRRAQEDIETITPSLFAGRKSSKKTADGAPKAASNGDAPKGSSNIVAEDGI